jgi:hypothetical protein
MADPAKLTTPTASRKATFDITNTFMLRLSAKAYFICENPNGYKHEQKSRSAMSL